jgi:ATP-dependent HslUV protease ATP-binding subunit HslU
VLHTILERVVEEICYEAPELDSKKVVVDSAYVRSRLDDILQKEDLSRFIL